MSTKEAESDEDPQVQWEHWTKTSIISDLELKEKVVLEAIKNVKKSKEEAVVESKVLGYRSVAGSDSEFHG
jgi:hypothetical protein